VPAHGTAVLVVRRAPLAAPAAPRAHEATLRISTTLGVERATDVPVRDDVRSPELALSAAQRDFGVVRVGDRMMLPIEVTNRGDAIARLAASAPAPLRVLLPMPLAPGGSGTAWVVYEPASAATAEGPVALSAAGSCQAPVALPFRAGVGPYAVAYDRILRVRGDCQPPPRSSFSFSIRNLGNRELQISCRPEAANELELELPSTTLIVPPGVTRSFPASLATPPIPPGGVNTGTGTFIECTDNEPITSSRAALITRDYYVSDEPCLGL
jgi:hypothetical protein